MRATLAKLDSSDLTRNESARLRCEAALELKDRGEYDRARDVMRPFWKTFGERPDTEGLYPEMAAELLLHVGILTRWIGSKNQVKESSQIASDLISESITYWESQTDAWKVAAARAELAMCYWREGALDNARVMFTEALKKLTAEGNTRANALLGLAEVERASSRYNDAMAILTNNARLFQKITNHTTKGHYHNQRAMVLRSLATAEKSSDYFERAIREYERSRSAIQAGPQHRLSRLRQRTIVGFLLFKLGRFKVASEYLTEARRLAVNAKDRILVAQFDDSLAKLYIATNELKEAEAAARRSINVLDKSGHQNTLAESLITYGIVLARLRNTDQAQFNFQRAIELAHNAGALSTAGIAAITMIEEIDDLSAETLSHAYEQAGEWLSTCQSQELWHRFKVAGKKVVRGLRSESEDAGILFNEPCQMETKVLEFEKRLISQALATANGRITHAAKWLDIGRQKLAYIIETRHPDLLKERSPVHRRSKKNTRKEN